MSETPPGSRTSDEPLDDRAAEAPGTAPAPSADTPESLVSPVDPPRGDDESPTPPTPVVDDVEAATDDLAGPEESPPLPDDNGASVDGAVEPGMSADPGAAPVSDPPSAVEPPPSAPVAPEARPGPVFAPAPPPPRDPTSGEAPVPEAATGATAPTAAVDPADDQVEPPDGSGGPAAKGGLKGRWPLVLLPLVVIAVVVGVFAVKRNTDEAVDKVKTPAAFVTFRDPERGFSINYPGSWKRVSRAPDPEIRLLVSNGSLDSLLVRVAPTAAPFPADLTGEEAKAVADVVVKRETFAPGQILKEQALNVNGSPGYYYLYTFEEDVKTDAGTTKVQGVHAHYVIFQGRRVFVLVFQALPTANFDRLAKTFDAMAESFRVTPLASDAPDPTTAPAETTPGSTPPAPADTTPPTSAPAPPG